MPIIKMISKPGNSKSWAVTIILICLAVTRAWSAEVLVPPGNNTLATAIAAASNGDILVLDNGVYSGTATVDKSLTLRAKSRGTEVVVSGIFAIDGADIDVTVQGLIFSTHPSLIQAGAVKLLENTFANNVGGINLSNYRTSHGDGSLAIIGNHFAPNNSITEVLSQNAYIAGNVLENGVIRVRTSAWIVGNEISCACSAAIKSHSNVGIVQIIGNRVTHILLTDSTLTNFGIHIEDATSSLIAGNVVKVTGSYGGPYIGIDTGSNFATTINNIVDGQNLTNDNNHTSGIRASSGRVAGNIVFDFPFAIVSSPLSTVENNLCFNNGTDCGTANGNLAVDPQFIDTTDYHLAVGSPAIDAGPPDFGLADLDRTRNDMGAHGGPWSIGQYDVQRDPGNLTPYVFPLFKADSSFTGSNLEIRALGAARLR